MIVTVDRHPHITYMVRGFLPSQLLAVQVANVSIWAFIYILCFENDMGMACKYLFTEITEQMKKSISNMRSAPSNLPAHAPCNLQLHEIKSAQHP